ncbi:MAG: HAD hydrolase family protein [Bacteroidales bacterium]|jgi:3-deoxy-D-manno-octulosonate 8-phosphate phosphatase (KDO 8-P phosphatase)|nr:HAD hydrolase family protein [Bacteroidales bacterium]
MARLNIAGKKIRFLLYDFDGVMTDNKVIVSEDGRENVICNRSDGLAIDKLKSLGLSQAIISTERNKIVSIRAAKLGIPVIQNVADKKMLVSGYCQKIKSKLKETLYIGNDLNDFEIMKSVGYPVCPQDAYQEIKKISQLILPVDGGQGVIRILLNYIKMED